MVSMTTSKYQEFGLKPNVDKIFEVFQKMLEFHWQRIMNQCVFSKRLWRKNLQV